MAFKLSPLSSKPERLTSTQGTRSGRDHGHVDKYSLMQEMPQQRYEQGHRLSNSASDLGAEEEAFKPGLDV